MTKTAPKILLRVTAVFFVLFSSVLAEKLPFKNYSVADGLANDFVSEIVRDSRGFLWFCTGEGLSRFDGYVFKNYTQAHGLPHRNVNDLLEFENGIYLTATSDGIAVFNPKGIIKTQSENQNSPSAEPLMFRTFRIPSETSDQRPIAVLALHKTRSGEIWAATDVGLYRILLTEAGELRQESVELKAGGSKIAEVFSITDDRFGRLWLGTSAGLHIFYPESGKSEKILENAGLSIIEDRQGRIWTGGGDSAINQGLNLFEISDGQSLPVLLRRFTEDVLDAQDISYRFYLSEKTGDIALGADIRREVYLIFKECLNNLFEYADATEVDLSVGTESNSLIVSVRDNGKGFVVGVKLNGGANGFGGNGLPNMRRRAESLGGVFEIESEKGAGTTVTFRIPLAGNSKRRSRLRF